MIPLRDDNPTRTFAFFTLLLIVANVAVFLYELTLPASGQLDTLIDDFGLVPSQVLHNPVAAGSAVTSIFLHGGWMHLIGNMLYLWIFGNNIEDSMGHVRFLCFYLICGLAAAAAQVAVSPESNVPMIGASGAVSGILGAYLLLFPRARVLMVVPIWIFLKLVYVPAWLVLLFWFGMQLLSAMTTVGRYLGGGVAFWAHIGGFAAGMLLIPFFKKRSARLFR